MRIRQTNGDDQARQRTFRHGYTLVELMIVIVLMSVLASLVLPRFEASVHDQLQSAAHIITGDLAYARNLAVSNDSQYTLTFRQPNNSYTLRHTGANHLLDVLPRTPHCHPDDAPDAQVTCLDELPHLGAAVEIVGISIGGATISPTGDVSFDALGGTATSQAVTIWLACGVDASRRYLDVSVAPVTGIATVGQYRGRLP